MSNVLQQLLVLEVRFRHQYHSPEADLLSKFDTATPFFTRISKEEIPGLATSMTQHHLREFHKLDVSGILEGNEYTRSLNIRWNRLCQEVEESSAVDEVRPSLIELALVRKSFLLVCCCLY
jgi:hypothetical protein